jgi:chromosome partitioning protein
MRTIAIVNQKGGCGKTITAINLSACLAQNGKNVLLIDLDPQGHATLGLDFKPEEVAVSTYHVLKGEVTLEGAMVSSGLPHLYLVPANIELSIFEQEFRDVPGKERRLLDAIEGLPARFDYLLVDCPPSLSLLSFNALRACDEVIVPVEPSFFSLHGVGKLMETLDVIEEQTGHSVRIGALPTMVDRRSRFVQEILDELQDYFGDRVFKTPIRMNIKLREAASFGWPITEYAKNAIGAWDYMALAEEVIAMEEAPSALTAAPELELVSNPSLEISLTRSLPTPSEKDQEDYVGVPISNLDGTLFVYRDPKARDVKLAGDFNDWIPDRGVVSFREEDGTWKMLVTLPSGNYQYKYLVDGEWCPDPSNPRVISNPLGGVNSIISIRQTSSSSLRSPLDETAEWSS